MVKYPDWAIRALERASVHSKVNGSSLEHYNDEGGFLELDELSVIDSAGPTELVGIAKGPPANVNPRWKIFVKRRYKLLTRSRRAGNKDT
jgi:hypothetical protein